MKIIVFLCLIQLSFFATAATTGSAGVKRNGTYLTVGGANILLEPDYSPEEIPQVIDYLKSAGLPDDGLQVLIKALLPNMERRYYRISKISNQEMSELKKVFSKSFQKLQVGDEIVVYAITNERETYFLPNYFSLSDRFSKMAILFSEALKLTGVNKADVNDQLYIESRFEKYIRCASGGVIHCKTELFQFINALYHKDSFFNVSSSYPYSIVSESTRQGRMGKFDVLEIYARLDLETGALAGLMDEQGSIALSEIIPSSLIDQAYDKLETPHKAYYATWVNIAGEPEFQVFIYDLMRKYPTSVLLKALYELDSLHLLFTNFRSKFLGKDSEWEYDLSSAKINFIGGSLKGVNAHRYLGQNREPIYGHIYPVVIEGKCTSENGHSKSSGWSFHWDNDVYERTDSDNSSSVNGKDGKCLVKAALSGV